MDMAKQRGLVNTIINLQVTLISGKFLGQFKVYELLKEEHVP
jgi:hypothetical protein